MRRRRFGLVFLEQSLRRIVRRVRQHRRIPDEERLLLALRRLPPQEDLLELSHDEIERRRLYPFSRMPSGLLDVLDEDEIRDLAAYVLSGANPASPEFQR